MSSHISARQQEIIEVAGKLISEKGLSHLTTKNLAKEMNFSEPALYRYFKNKEMIVVAMLRYLAENMQHRLSKIQEQDHSAQETLQEIFENQFRFFEKNPHFVTAVFADGLWQQSSLINTEILHLLQIKRQHIATVLQKGQNSKEFTQSVPLKELTKIVMGSFRLHMFSWKIGNFQSNLHTEGMRLFSSLLILIKEAT